MFLQLLYKNEFKIHFLNILKVKYEKMIMLALNNEAYKQNYKCLDTNLDRGMHFHSLAHWLNVDMHRVDVTNEALQLLLFWKVLT